MKYIEITDTTGRTMKLDPKKYESTSQVVDILESAPPSGLVEFELKEGGAVVVKASSIIHAEVKYRKGVYANGRYYPPQES